MTTEDPNNSGPFQMLGPPLPATQDIALERKSKKDRTVAMLKESTRIGVPIIVIAACCCSVIGLLYGNLMVKFGEVNTRIDEVRAEFRESTKGNQERDARLMRVELEAVYDRKKTDDKVQQIIEAISKQSGKK